jgi:stage II sporulation SpoD-like protein
MIRPALLLLAISLLDTAVPGSWEKTAVGAGFLDRLARDMTYESRAEVRVGVFGLFHPRTLVVSSAGGVISVRSDRDSCVLRGREQAQVDLNGGFVRMACAGAVFSTGAIRVTGPAGQGADLELSVPGRITRRFHGRLDVIAAGDELAPVVSMDLETAVASVVAAEQIASAPLEALKAQAVAARSFFAAAGRRHHSFEFCDTTHCQFLREPPGADHPAARAARETAGLVLAFRGTPISAFYSASCGGRTRTLADAGLRAADGYPYFSVECAYCVRQHAAGDRNGHGVGLCQEGAAGMAAEHGASFAEILQHYYPGTTLEMRSP